MMARLSVSGKRQLANLPVRKLAAWWASLPWDGFLAIALFAAGLAAYVSTLAPSVLDGDAALFQYTPWVLGVTYPTGYPTYMLLGRLWASLLPVGSIAYRMNLLSAVCGALALALLYPALRRLLESRLGALMAVLIFATLPTYWRWATEAKIYTLHILLLSGILFLISRRSEMPARSLLPAAVLFGLALGNHSTTVLMAPGLFLLFWLTWPSSGSPGPVTGFRKLDRPRVTGVAWRLLPYLLFSVLLPVVLYLYVPVRAEWLLARGGNLSGLLVPVAVAQGTVADFYHSGLAGLAHYFTAADFTGGVVTNWGLVPRQVVTVYWPLVKEDFGLWGALLSLVGAMYLALWRPRRFWPLFLMYVVLIPFVLTYGQGEQSAFLLPSSLMLASFCGAALAGGLRLISGIRDWGLRTRDRASHRPSAVPSPRAGLIQAILMLALLGSVGWLPLRHARYNADWLTGKWDDAAYQYWTDVLSHPMEPGAGMLAHWGDLTSFWYLQHVEGLRPDLYGLYPPTEEVVVEWLAAGHDLYIAGPLQGWAAGVEKRYQLLPWGRLVRLAPHNLDPRTLLPALPDAPQAARFGDRIGLLKAGFSDQVASGDLLPVTLAWQTTHKLPADAHISLRLVDDEGSRIAQTDEALVSGWLPADALPAGQVLLSFSRFKLPAGTLPGEYLLQLAVFEPHAGTWSLENGQLALNLGRVKVGPARPSQPVDAWGEYKPLAGFNFGDEIRLVGYDYSVTRAGQGKGFAARFLWQAIRPPSADYSLLVELVDAGGTVWREWQHTPADGRAPTSTWTAGQVVRDEVGLVLPANAPPGEDTLRVRLSWLGPQGARLAVRRWFLPAGDSVTLPGVRVVEEQDRRFEPPPMQYTVKADFDDKIELIGYDLPTTRISPGDTLPLTLIWRSLSSDMRESYTVFVHLVGPDGAIHGQWDKEPGQRSKQPTTSWVRDEIVVDPIPVPLATDAPAGTYRVLVGLYLAPDGPRLLLRHETGQVAGDALDLTRIEVVH
jgi:hypothetical protein